MIPVAVLCVPVAVLCTFQGLNPSGRRGTQARGTVKVSLPLDISYKHALQTFLTGVV